MRLIFGIFPLLAVPALIYNLMAFAYGGKYTDSHGQTVAGSMADSLDLGSKMWIFASGDILVVLALFFFFFEILKATSTGTASIANHAVSMLLFVGCLVEFLLLPNFQTSTYFIITIMCLLDVLAGVVVTIISARRDYTVSEPGHGN